MCPTLPTRRAWCITAALVLCACSEGELRGRAVASADGGTYLVVEDDNGDQCGPLRLDGHEWKSPLHVPGRISPGVHEIACGGAVQFEVQEGTTFHFNYWGP
jgi:hypothetical protein